MHLPANATPERFVGTGPLGLINTEWASLTDTPTPPAWVDACTDLSPAATLGDVLRAIAAGNAHSTDRILHALLSAHHTGDDLAGRTLLQTMLGSVRRLTHTGRYRCLDDATSAALEAMWTSITSYPLRRRHSVAANLALGALHRMEAAAERPLPAGDLLDLHIHRAQETGRLGGESPEDATAQATKLLAWALDTGVLEREDVALLANSYLSDRDPEDLATELGVTRSAVRHRRAKAVRALAAAVRSDVEALPI